MRRLFQTKIGDWGGDVALMRRNRPCDDSDLMRMMGPPGDGKKRGLSNEGGGQGEAITMIREKATSKKSCAD